jgi:hypothetical protein
LSASWKLAGREDGVLGLRRNLVLAELGDIVVSPCLAVLRIVNDLAARLAVVLNDLNDVGPSGPLGYAFDVVGRIFGFEGFEEIDLSAFAQFLSVLLVKAAL